MRTHNEGLLSQVEEASKKDNLKALIFQLATDWAETMEKKLAEDPTLKVADIAKSSLVELLKGEELTGNIYFGVCSIIGHLWFKGDEFLKEFASRN